MASDPKPKLRVHRTAEPTPEPPPESDAPPEQPSPPPPHDPAALVERILTEKPIGVAAAAKLMGTFWEGKTAHASTITRWATKGVKLTDGRVIRLEAVKINGRLVTSRAALIRFISAQQDPPPTEVTESSTRAETPAQRRASASRASNELDGLLGNR
jgi:hypothetical protein